VIHSTIWSSMRGPSSSFSKLFNKIEKISSRLFSVFTYPDNVLTPWIVPVLALTAKPCKRLLNVPPTIRQFIPLTGNDFKNDGNQASRGIAYNNKVISFAGIRLTCDIPEPSLMDNVCWLITHLDSWLINVSSPFFQLPSR